MKNTDEEVVPKPTKEDYKRKGWEDYTWPAAGYGAPETARSWIRRALAAETRLKELDG